MMDTVEDNNNNIGRPIDEDGQDNSINISENEDKLSSSEENEQFKAEDTEQEKKSKSKVQDRIDWRRGKVAELSSQGFTLREIGEVLKVSKSSVGEDIQYLRQEARKNLAQYNERLPHEFESVMTGITSILKRSIQESQTAVDIKTKMMCLNLAKDCYSMKLDLLTNLNLLETAVKFLDNHKTKQDKDEQSEAEEIIDNG